MVEFWGADWLCMKFGKLHQKRMKNPKMFNMFFLGISPLDFLGIHLPLLNNSISSSSGPANYSSMLQHLGSSNTSYTTLDGAEVYLLFALVQ
jgi:hypothetical protein